VGARKARGRWRGLSEGRRRETAGGERKACEAAHGISLLFRLKGTQGTSVEESSRSGHRHNYLVAGAPVWSEIFIVLAFFALVLVGVGRAILLAGDVRPFGGEAGIELEPFLEPALGVGQNRLGRAFALAHAAVD